jgi:ribosomal protein L21E
MKANMKKLEKGDVVLIEWKDKMPNQDFMKPLNGKLGIITYTYQGLFDVECNDDDYYWHSSSLHLISKGDFK